jgi:hypothetical protein
MTATTDTGLTVGGLDGQFFPRRPSLDSGIDRWPSTAGIEVQYLSA